MNASQMKVGLKVTYSGFPGTVVALCEWSLTKSADEMLVEVRMPRGYICVTCKDLVAA